MGRIVVGWRGLGKSEEKGREERREGKRKRMRKIGNEEWEETRGEREKAEESETSFVLKRRKEKKWK